MKWTNPKNPQHFIESDLSHKRALELLRPLIKTDKFISSIVASAELGRLSDSLRFWMYVKAEAVNPDKVTNPLNQMQVGAGFARIHTMFKQASETLENPRIVLQDSIGNRIDLTLAKATSKNPNHIYLKVNKEYCGKISPEGLFSPTRECPDTIKDYLQQFADDPATVAGNYGRATGRCCFCRIKLTDGRSVQVGYGPICAEKYGLPWG